MQKLYVLTEAPFRQLFDKQNTIKLVERFCESANGDIKAIAEVICESHSGRRSQEVLME